MRQPSDYAYDASDPFGSMAGGRTYPHTGSDWFAPTGSNVYAVADGDIIASGWHDGNGNYLAQTLPDGKTWSYIHLSEQLVTSGRVSKGQVIARSGNTGYNSRGPHLHSSCAADGNPKVYVGIGQLIDPYNYLVSTPDQNTEEQDMRVIRSDNGRVALVGEFYQQEYVSQDDKSWYGGIHTKTFGEVKGLSSDEFQSLLNSASQRRTDLVNAMKSEVSVDVDALAAAIAAQIPGGGCNPEVIKTSVEAAMQGDYRVEKI